MSKHELANLWQQACKMPVEERRYMKETPWVWLSSLLMMHGPQAEVIVPIWPET
jgi:hypothetical protein